MQEAELKPIEGREKQRKNIDREWERKRVKEKRKKPVPEASPHYHKVKPSSSRQHCSVLEPNPGWQLRAPWLCLCAHTHKQANSAQAHLCQAFPLSQEVQVAGPVALLPVTMTNTVSWESTQRDDKEGERRVGGREGRKRRRWGWGNFKKRKKNVFLLVYCFWGNAFKT